MLTFDSPVSIGGLSGRKTVSRLEISAISINLQKGHVRRGEAILSVVLEDPDSDFQQPITIKDVSVLEFLGGIKAELAALLAPVWQKLQDDGKLPAGTVDVQIPKETEIDAAVTKQAEAAGIAGGPQIGLGEVAK